MSEGVYHCKSCGNEEFTSRNQLFKHLKVCLLNRNPKNYDIIPDEVFFSENLAYIYVTGGRVRGKTLDSFERYCCNTDTWESLGNMKEHRGSHSSVVIGQTLYVIGGGGLHHNLASGEQIDCITLENSPIQVMNSFRHAMSVVAILDSPSDSSAIYAIGGWEDGSRCCHQLEKYNVNLQQWSDCEPMPTARRLFGATVHQQKIYCFGGKREDGIWDTNVLEIYDSLTNTWSTGKPLPYPGQTSAITIKDFIYVIIHGGGIYRYDPSTDSYVLLTSSLPLNKWFCFDVTTVNQEIYFHGGNVDGKWSNELFKYHPYLDRWTHLTPMQKERRRCSAATFVVRR